MKKVEFLFDKEKDLWNNWRTCNEPIGWYDFTKGMDKQIINICKGKEFRKAKPKLERYLEKIYNLKEIDDSLKASNNSWSKIEEEYFKRLEKITKKPININKIKGYLTTSRRCPYNLKENWFMVNLFSGENRSLAIAGHEIMHLHFHKHYWKKIEKKLKYNKTADLKEALTVLLNLEFRDLWSVIDKGYEKHKKLRKFIESQWKKKKDFDVLLEKCVKYIKSNDH